MTIFAVIEGIEFFYTAFERIYVSKCGKILLNAISPKTKQASLRLKKIYITPDGYCTTNIAGKVIRVHRLIAQTFIPNPENKPEVNHKDCNKQNNHVDNLEWVTPEENFEHAVLNGKIKKSIITSEDVYGYSKRDLLKIKNDFYKQIKDMDVAPLSYTTCDDISSFFSKYFDIQKCAGARIKVKDAVDILRNNLVTVSAIKAYLSKTFKVVNIHGILYYKDLIINEKSNTKKDIGHDEIIEIPN